MFIHGHLKKILCTIQPSCPGPISPWLASQIPSSVSLLFIHHPSAMLVFIQSLTPTSSFLTAIGPVPLLISLPRNPFPIHRAEGFLPLILAQILSLPRSDLSQNALTKAIPTCNNLFPIPKVRDASLAWTERSPSWYYSFSRPHRVRLYNLLYDITAFLILHASFCLLYFSRQNEACRSTCFNSTCFILPTLLRLSFRWNL